MGIDITTLKSVRDELDRYVAQYDDCIRTAPSRRHFATVVRGQLSDLERKSVEPIALEAGTPPRTLQEFFSLHKWDHDKVRVRLQQLAAAHVGDAPTMGVIDETGMPKKGDKTPAVQRQYCGQTGKLDNCTVHVQLALATNDFHTLIDEEPFLPESWSDDRERCRNAGIPDEVEHRPKWQIGLELYDRAVANGVRFDWIVADEAYGAVPAFRDALDERGQRWVVEVPSTLHGWTKPPKMIVPAKTATMGRPRTREQLAPGQKAARPVHSLWQRGGPSWRYIDVKPTTKGRQVWNTRVIRFIPQRRGQQQPGEPRWLIIAKHALNDAHKYFLSNAPENMPPEKLIEIAFGRWHIEQCFEDAKREVGLNHFEVRTWIAMRRHSLLCMVSLLFLSLQTQRLREKKSGPFVEPYSGEADRGGATRPADSASRARQATQAPSHATQLPPHPQPRSR